LTGEWTTAIPRVKHAWTKIRADQFFTVRGLRFAFSKAADGAFDQQ
jgi:hypothetical protein